MDYKKNYFSFNNLIIISGFYKSFQQIAVINIKFYIKYLYIFYGILVNILYFTTHYIGGKKAENSENSFKEFIIIKKR